MKKKLPDVTASKKDLLQLVLRTHQWYQTVFVQLRRFMDAAEASEGNLPWSDNIYASLIHTDRAFLIESVFRTYKYIHVLNTKLQQCSSYSFDDILEKIEYEDLFPKIASLRNINEHEEEYVLGGGRERDKMCAVHSINGRKVKSHAFTTYINGNIPVFMVGTMDIVEVACKLKSCQPEFARLCEMIFNDFEINEKIK